MSITILIHPSRVMDLLAASERKVTMKSAPAGFKPRWTINAVPVVYDVQLPLTCLMRIRNLRLPAFGRSCKKRWMPKRRRRVERDVFAWVLRDGTRTPLFSVTEVTPLLLENYHS